MSRGAEAADGAGDATGDGSPDGGRDAPRPTGKGTARLSGFAAQLAAQNTADSAGQPWDGRQFDDNTFGGDDGAAPQELLDALADFRAGLAGPEAVVDALRTVRLLVPLMAELGDSGTTGDGLLVDKSQELSLVTVAGPDGRTVQPVFSSVEAMRSWNPLARPVPVEGVRVALAAASEGTELVVLDPTSATEFAVRRPALWAMARGEAWVPSDRDPGVRDAFAASIASELGVHRVELAAGDPGAHLVADELVVRLTLAAGLTQSELDAILGRLARRWAADDLIATRVDSLRVQLTAAEEE